MHAFFPCCPDSKNIKFFILFISLLALISGGCSSALDKRSSANLSVKERIASDYRHFYTVKSMSKLAVGLGGVGILASSGSEDNIREWFQDSVRDERTDDLSEIVKPLGDGKYTLPVFLGAALLGKLTEETAPGAVGGAWAGRSLRTMIVGVPHLLFLQTALGSPRPKNGRSYWQPFQHSQGVSGHSYMGAVPFLSAAMMTENFFLKTLWYAGSTLCGISRINDDKHYLSQVLAGWWLAYLSAKSVDGTETQGKNFALTPAVFEHGVGIALNITF